MPAGDTALLLLHALLGMLRAAAHRAAVWTIPVPGLLLALITAAVLLITVVPLAQSIAEDVRRRKGARRAR